MLSAFAPPFHRLPSLALHTLHAPSLTSITLVHAPDCTSRSIFPASVLQLDHCRNSVVRFNLSPFHPSLHSNLPISAYALESPYCQVRLRRGRDRPLSSCRAAALGTCGAYPQVCLCCTCLPLRKSGSGKPLTRTWQTWVSFGLDRGGRKSVGWSYRELKSMYMGQVAVVAWKAR